MTTNENMSINHKVYLNINIMITLKAHNKNYKTIIIIPIFYLVDNL